MGEGRRQPTLTPPRRGDRRQPTPNPDRGGEGKTGEMGTSEEVGAKFCKNDFSAQLCA
ncbi:hypothetical protein CYANOKiyG1_71210 [Okeania sp. KiyG1]|nr:hypothetical protein CYANOKiyG1_71210 [Okeania sp. KiyG1]